MHCVCATYVNFVLFFIDRVPVNATIVNEAAHTVISDEAENPLGTRADHLGTSFGRRCFCLVSLFSLFLLCVLKFEILRLVNFRKSTELFVEHK